MKSFVYGPYHILPTHSQSKQLFNEANDPNFQIVNQMTLPPNSAAPQKRNLCIICKLNQNQNDQKICYTCTSDLYEYNTDKNVYKCGICKGEFPTELVLFAHINSKHF